VGIFYRSPETPGVFNDVVVVPDVAWNALWFCSAKRLRLSDSVPKNSSPSKLF
jgi:hypothetical protein